MLTDVCDCLNISGFQSGYNSSSAYISLIRQELLMWLISWSVVSAVVKNCTVYVLYVGDIAVSSPELNCVWITEWLCNGKETQNTLSIDFTVTGFSPFFSASSFISSLVFLSRYSNQAKNCSMNRGSNLGRGLCTAMHSCNWASPPPFMPNTPVFFRTSWWWETFCRHIYTYIYI